MQIHVLEYWEDTVARYPEREAVVDGDRVATFADLERASWSLASGIMQWREDHRQPIVVFIPKSIEAVIGFLAILKSGNFYVPLDTSSPAERIEKIIGSLKPAGILVSNKLLPKLEELDTGDIPILKVEFDADQNTIDLPEVAARSESRVQSLIDTDPVYIKYTSGSTGMPKGVALPHRAIIDYVDWARDEFRITEQSVIGNQAPFYFDVSVQDVYLCFATGAKLVILAESLFIFPVKLLEYIEQQQVTFFCWVPSIVVNIANMNLLGKVPLTHLKIVSVLGEVMPTRHFNIWIGHLPDVEFYNTYGPTEAAIASTFYKVDREFDDSESLPIGKPCRNTEMLILDEQENLITETNVFGELCIRGSSLALGYWDDPDKTNQAFVRNPAQSHYRELVYRTGDLGCWNERGELIFSGRKDSQIKHLGYRIELGEIETAAAGLDTVDSCCVLYNASRQEITMFYTADEELDQAATRAELRQRLPAYMLPKIYSRLSEFPLNANGKVDRKALSQEHFST